ncbi:MAG: hypothetical protein V3S81_05230 [Anaerolineales bacterium]
MEKPIHFSPNSPAGQAPRAASRSEAEWARLTVGGMPTLLRQEPLLQE